MATGDTFYFIIHPNGDRQAVQVIDLSTNAGARSERSDWVAISDHDFEDRTEALLHARTLAMEFGLRYVPFESRYNSDLNEKPLLTLR